MIIQCYLSIETETKNVFRTKQITLTNINLPKNLTKRSNLECCNSAFVQLLTAENFFVQNFQSTDLLLIPTIHHIMINIILQNSISIAFRRLNWKF